MGHVDYGGLIEESDRIATEALVFIAVGLSGRWKMPVAYFSTDHASADIQKNLVVDCIKRLMIMASQFVLLHVTEVNFSMFRHLGVETDEPYFSHPCNSNIKVFGICDVCHMLKLVQNTLGI